MVNHNKYKSITLGIFSVLSLFKLKKPDVVSIDEKEFVFVYSASFSQKNRIFMILDEVVLPDRIFSKLY